MRSLRIVMPLLSMAALVSGCYQGLDPDSFTSSGIASAGPSTGPSTGGGESSTDDTAEGGSQSGGTDDPDTTDSDDPDPTTTDGTDTDPDPTTSDPTDGTDTDDPDPTTTGGDPNILDGLSINEVAIYQGPKRTLAVNGSKANSNVPLVQGRDALVRVFYSASGEAAGAQVRAVLDIEGEGPLEVNTTVNGSSTDASLNSTINFELDGSQVGANFDYSVAIYAAGETQVPSAAHPNAGSENHNVEAGQQTFRLVLVPYRYNADGSGRLPDTSNAAVAAYRERFLQTYPVSDVEVSVHAPVDWNSALQPNGSGWQQVMDYTAQLRNNENPNPSVYYYGIFNPASSFNQFCGGGCLLGVTYLNSNNSPQLRWAVGVGFLEVATDTSIHEIGHSHGRAHVNCGQGLDPNSIDNAYPHATNTIGVWAWDIVDGGLLNPGQHTDFMGYCNSQFVSDYTFRALYLRGDDINQPNIVEPGGLALLSMDEQGGTQWVGPMDRMPAFDWPANAIATLTDEQGRSSEVEGHYVGFDHIGGGHVFLPESAMDAASVEVRLIR